MKSCFWKGTNMDFIQKTGVCYGTNWTVLGSDPKRPQMTTKDLEWPQMI